MKKSGQGVMQFLVVLSGLILACIVIAVCSSEPLTALEYFFKGPFSSTYFFGNMLSYSVPLIITGLSAAIAYKASIWNLGTEGQMFFGMLCGTWVAYLMYDCPKILTIIASILASFVGGAFMSWLSVFLQKAFKVNIMMSSLLISNASFYIVMYVLEGPFNDPNSASGVCSPKFNPDHMFTKIMGTSDLHTGIFIAIALVILVAVFMKCHKTGYEITLSGLNPKFATYGGISAASILTITMILSGGLAGVGGMVDILGVHGKMRCMLTNFGWDGVSIAMISRNNPVLIFPVALFFAFLEKGVESAALFSDISPDVAQIIEAVILFLSTSEFLFDLFRKKKKQKKEQPVIEKGIEENAALKEGTVR